MYATSSRSIARALGRPGSGKPGILCSSSLSSSGSLRRPLLLPTRTHATEQHPRPRKPKQQQPAIPLRSSPTNPTTNPPPAGIHSTDDAQQPQQPPQTPPRNIAILGGGLTGLTAAWYLARAMPQAKITLYEASGRLGGWIDTEKVEVEGGDGRKGTVYLERAARMVKPLTGSGRVPRWDDVVFFDLVGVEGLDGVVGLTGVCWVFADGFVIRLTSLGSLISWSARERGTMPTPGLSTSPTTSLDFPWARAKVSSLRSAPCSGSPR